MSPGEFRDIRTLPRPLRLASWPIFCAFLNPSCDLPVGILAFCAIADFLFSSSHGDLVAHTYIVDS